MVPLVSQPTCEDGGDNHVTLLALFDSTEADLIFRSREQAGQGVIGYIAVNHHAVHTSYGRHQMGEGLNDSCRSELQGMLLG